MTGTMYTAKTFDLLTDAGLLYEIHSFHLIVHSFY